MPWSVVEKYALNGLILCLSQPQLRQVIHLWSHTQKNQIWRFQPGREAPAVPRIQREL